MYKLEITHANAQPEVLRNLSHPAVLSALIERCYSGRYAEVSTVLVTREDGKRGPKTASFVHAAYEAWRASTKKEQAHA
jgi:hypothetical protein